jgi:hypothetical protein
MRRFSKPWLPVILVAVAAGASCSKPAERTPTGTGSAEPARPERLTVDRVELGRSIGGDKHVTDRTDTFAPDDTIYAAVHTTGTASSAILKARWTYEDGQLVDESEERIAPTGSAATEFHISKPDGWPAGKYKLEVFLDGVPVQTKEFDVRAA